jgi:hypothetical protein
MLGNIGDLLLIVIVLVALGLIAFSLYSALTSQPDVASGWWQVFLGSISVPVVFYQLEQIRQALNRKPKISIGLARVSDLPVSRIRDIGVLPTTVTVSQGYPHFFLVVRNQGKVAARFVKIHFEHKPGPSDQSSLLFPVVKVSEFSSDKPSFWAENNYEFVFTGGPDWHIHPNDFEVFGFHLTTVVVKQKEPYELMEYPEPGDCPFQCTVWAEALGHPVTEQLTVRIKEERE